jgi:hypothetical protein
MKHHLWTLIGWIAHHNPQGRHWMHKAGQTLENHLFQHQGRLMSKVV